jgi:hypothetical protein
MKTLEITIEGNSLLAYVNFYGAEMIDAGLGKFK